MRASVPPVQIVMPWVVAQRTVYTFPVAGLVAVTLASSEPWTASCANARKTLSANPHVVCGPALMFWSHAV
jgi:hypothetical protein